jgi:hypothetical protein
LGSGHPSKQVKQAGRSPGKLDKGVDFEMFRLFPEEDLSKETSGKGGRSAYDYVMMFKILIFRRYYIRLNIISTKRDEQFF